MTQSTGGRGVNQLNVTEFNEALARANNQLDTLAQVANSCARQLQQVGGSSSGQSASGQNSLMSVLGAVGQMNDAATGIRSLSRVVTPATAGVGALAAVAGTLGYSLYQGSTVLSDFNKTLILSGNSAGLTTDAMLGIARAGQATGLTFEETSNVLTQLVKAGISAGANFEQMTTSVGRFTEASGVPVENVVAAFARVNNDPVGGLIAMAQQFHNVSVEQIEYVAQLERSGDHIAALTAANELASQGFDQQTASIRNQMGTLERAADSVKNTFKSMWDSVLNIGRPDTAEDILQKAKEKYDKAKSTWDREKDSKFISQASKDFFWDALVKASIELDMAQKTVDSINGGKERGAQQAQNNQTRLQYADEASRISERNKPARQRYLERINKLQSDFDSGNIDKNSYDILLKDTKKQYELVNNFGGSNSGSVELSAQLKILQEQQDTKIDDQIALTQKLIALKENSSKYVSDVKGKISLLDKTAGLGTRQAQRERERNQLVQDWTAAGGGESDPGLKDKQNALNDFYQKEDQLRGNGLNGIKNAWADYRDAATDTFSTMKSFALDTFNAIGDNMLSMLTTGKANWAEFTRSTLSMLTQILMKQAMVGLIDSASKAFGFAVGGYTGPGAKYEPAGVVHRGEFVFTKEATSRIGVSNLYRLMRGYASGGYVGESTAALPALSGVSVYAPVTVQSTGPGTDSNPQGMDQLGKAYQQVIDRSINEGIAKAIRPGGLIWNTQHKR